MTGDFRSYARFCNYLKMPSLDMQGLAYSACSRGVIFPSFIASYLSLGNWPDICLLIDRSPITNLDWMSMSSANHRWESFYRTT